MIQLFTGLFLYGGLKEYEEVKEYSRMVLSVIGKEEMWTKSKRKEETEWKIKSHW